VKYVLLHASDNVVVAVEGIVAGEALEEAVAATQDIPQGHKIARRDIAQGDAVVKFGQVIGVALEEIVAGSHVHSHNLGMPEKGTRNEAAVKIEQPAPSGKTFKGFVRANGRVGTRNYLGVLTTVTCSGTVAQTIADEVEKRGILRNYKNIDGIVPIAHGTGCGMNSVGPGMENLQRTLWGYASHPNLGGALVVGLGCEVNQLPLMMDAFGMAASETLRTFNIQDMGGTRATVEAGIKAVEEMAPLVNDVRRETRPASDLVLAVQCGASDGFSGVSANPALGRAGDLLVADGGTVILAETPEIYGAEHILKARAKDEKVAGDIDELICWWEDYVSRNGGEIDNNPTPGNKRGGLTTIVEKSLGAIAKAGTSPMNGVYKYAERVRERGLVFMDSPGYDPCSITGQIASGATVVCFTTGRGSTTGFKPAPCMKLASNSTMYERMKEDMDVDCGTVLDRRQTVDEAGSSIYDHVLDVASGRQTKSEELGYGRNEFVPWQIGAVV